MKARASHIAVHLTRFRDQADQIALLLQNAGLRGVRIDLIFQVMVPREHYQQALDAVREDQHHLPNTSGRPRKIEPR